MIDIMNKLDVLIDAIRKAIGDEDGLDGAEGERALVIIDELEVEFDQLKKDLEDAYCKGQQLCQRCGELLMERIKLKNVMEHAKFCIDRFYQDHELKHHVREWGIRELQQSIDEWEKIFNEKDSANKK